MNSVYLLLGSNQGDRTDNLTQALSLLASKAGIILQQSAVYETAAWGKTDQPGFLNQAVQLSTLLSPDELLAGIHSIEQQLGRQRIEKWGQRTLDIDILFFGNAVIRTERLAIPHPELPNRRFALLPLNEIAPQLQHPELLMPVRQLLDGCPDRLTVIPYCPE